MKSFLLKASIVALMLSAAGSAYFSRAVWLGYLAKTGHPAAPGVAADPAVMRTPDGTRLDPFVGHGVIRSVVADQRRIVLEHGEIPGFMGPMTMSYDASPDLPVESLRRGDAVEFRLERLEPADQGAPVYQVFSVVPDPSADAVFTQEPSAATFTVDTSRQQLIGVRTSAVAYESYDQTLRTIGTVELDETRISEVHPRITGWIEETFVDFQYQLVERGDPLFTLYSPELVATQEEYLLALRGLETLGTSSFPSVALGAEDLVRAARRRLELWDITPRQIADLEEAREPFRVVTIYSPVTGNVMVRNAYTGQRVGPETMLYQIADHSVVWVRADVYERDFSRVELGQPAVMRVQALPGREFRGQVTFVDPHVNAQTRTLSVRLEFLNPDLALRPGMYADVELTSPMGRRLVVPESAVLPTGLRNVVFVDHGEGRMEIRDVGLGARLDGHYEVLSGLEEGERVVTSGNFLIDAESQLQAAEPVWQNGEAP
jgi:membrane fusion protein, copper/silver efflux system